MVEARLIHVLENAGKPSIAVLGDQILDRFVWGEVDRISPEAPIQVLAVRREEDRLGGAANVARNLAHLGARVFCAGVVGKDDEGRRMVDVLRTEGISSGLVSDPSRATSLKTRMIARSQQVLRVDREVVDDISKSIEEKLLKKISARKSLHAIVISDYRKGGVTPGLVKKIIRHGRKTGIPVLAGPKGHDLEHYKGVTLLSLNRKELGDVEGRPLKTMKAVETAAKKLRKALQAEFLVTTLGADGMLVVGDGVRHHVHARARSVFDVTGAGDTALGTLAFCLAAGTDIKDAMELANRASGLVVGKIGTATVTRDELVGVMSGDHLFGDSKILKRGELKREIQHQQGQGRSVVFTNGCFDLLHPGHLQTLEFAKDQGDVLVLGLNSDRSIRRIKGPNRPMQDEMVRARLLAALEIVDYVCLFNEDTPEKLIRAIRPDVLVKGEDWRGKKVAGSDAVGKVVFAPLRDGFSTTDLIEKIRTADDPQQGRKI